MLALWIEDRAMKHRVEVNTAGDPPDSWAGNAIRHDTAEEAEAAAKDLFFRWTAVKWWRVIDEDDTVHYTNKLEGDAW